MTALKRLMASTAAIVIAVTAGVMTTVPAHAADPSTWDPGFIISDEEFFDGGAMTESQVQSFLQEKGSGCTSTATLSCMKDYRAAQVDSRAASDYCAGYAGGSNLSAAAIIYRVAVACDISPKVLLVTLQKEQGLVTSAKSARAYEYAMGWGCPDTPEGCSSSAAGFAYQIYRAAQQFQVYAKTDFGAFKPGATFYIPYQVASVPGCGGSNVFIRNQATAGLYNYTPYQPNAAALAAGYGTGDACSAYGNRNFWLFYTDWFGPAANLLQSASFEGSTTGWSVTSGAGLALKSSSTNAQSGSHYLSTSTSRSGAALRQISYGDYRPGETYSASVWVKSRSTSSTFSGALRIVAPGSPTETATVPFTVGAEWTEVTAVLPLTSRHSSLRFEIVEQTTGISLAVDSAVLARGEDRISTTPVRLLNPSFEGSANGWSASRTDMKFGLRTNLAAWPAASGSSFLLASTPSPRGIVRQTVTYPVEQGRAYTVRIQVRTSSSQPFQGSLILRGIGGTTDSARTDFSADREWSTVQTTYVPRVPGITQLRVEIRLDTVSANLHLDDALMTSNLIGSTSFENGDEGWAPGTGSVNTALRVGGDPHPDIPDGKAALKVNRTSTGPASLALNLPREVGPGERMTLSFWVRSGDDRAVRGTLRLWGFGSATEHGSATFQVGREWTLVTTEFTPTMPVDSLRPEVYFGTSGGLYEIDGLWLR